MKKRIVIVTQWFDPEPTSKGLCFANALINQGFDVQVITGFPNYPGGKIYPGFKIKFIQRDFMKKVLVTRVPLYPSHGKSALGRLINYLSFSLSVLIYGYFLTRGADVLYVYHPPLTVGIAACLIKKITNIPIVIDIQDIWPDSLRATGFIKSNFLLKLISILCSYVYKRSNYIVVLSHGFKAALVNRGVQEDKIGVIYNWTNEELIDYSKIISPMILKNDCRVKIMFAGNIGKAQALETIIDVASLVKHKLPNVCFIILGSGIELSNIKNYTFQKKLENVIFLPPVPMSEVNNYLQCADILMVHLKADPLFEITIPSKTQAYMASGKPILMAVQGEAAKLVQAAKCGLTAKSEDPAEIADVIEKLTNLDKNQLIQLGKNGFDYYHSNLSLIVGTHRFKEIFQFVLNSEN